MNMTTTSRKMIDAAELASVRRAKYGRRKLVNQVAGIEAGQRPGAPLPKQSVLAVAHMLAAGAIEQATDRHQIQGLVKKALAPLAALAAPQRLQGGAA